MRSLIVSLVVSVVVTVLLATGCAPAAPAQSPTAAPVKAAEPTKASAAPAAAPTIAPAAAPTKAASAPGATSQPTAASASKVEFPIKGKAITIIVTSSAGAGADFGARIRAPLLEKELGVPVEVVNKPGAATQLGLTELARARPDGHTFGTFHLPTSLVTYLDTSRKAAYGRKDFRPIALDVSDPVAIGVRADSPFKTVKDLVDAARAEPGKISASAIGPLSDLHLGILLLERATGVRFGTVHFQGWAEVQPALLGGHVMVSFQTAGNFLPGVKNGQLRVLGIMDSQPSRLFPPEVKTLKEQGFDVAFPSSRGYVAPAGVPSEVAEILARGIKRTIDDGEVKAKMDGAGFPQLYMGPAEFDAYWTQMEKLTSELMELGSKQ